MDLDARTRLAHAVLTDVALAARVVERLNEVAQPEVADAESRAELSAIVRQHGEFFAGALQAGSPALFADYVRWRAIHDRARGMEVSNLCLQLELLGDQLSYAREQRPLVEKTLSVGLDVLRETPGPEAQVDERDPIRIDYLSAALGGDRERAWGVIERSRETLSMPDVYLHVLLWAQRRLGELWTEAQITVAQEHMASAITQAMLARLCAASEGPRNRGRAIIAGVQAELHSLPAQFAADLLEFDGWDVAFVGTHCPQRSLLRAIEAEQPDVLGLSVTLTSHLPETVRIALAVSERFPSMPIVLGGHAASCAPELLQELRAAAPGGDPRDAFRAFSR